MADDIRFYDFEFNLLYILPPGAENNGYISINTTMDYNGEGALEILFYDSELKQTVEHNRNKIFIVWRDFQGFITSYQWKKKQYRLIGMSLNGLLHRAVIRRTTDITDNVENIAYSLLGEYAQWISLGSKKGFTKEVTFTLDEINYADEVIKQLLDEDNAGYRVYADFETKAFTFECIKSKDNDLLLSGNNLNAYDFETIYTNKEMAFGGWYYRKQSEGDPVLTYITLDDTKEGIYNIDTILSAETANAALIELKEKKEDYSVTAVTYNVLHGRDYDIGDRIRLQDGDTTDRKMVTSIKMSQEKTYTEEPKFSDYKEETD